MENKDKTEGEKAEEVENWEIKEKAKSIYLANYKDYAFLNADEAFREGIELGLWFANDDAKRTEVWATDEGEKAGIIEQDAEKYQPLFDLMFNDYGETCLASEMDEIIKASQQVIKNFEGEEENCNAFTNLFKDEGEKAGDNVEDYEARVRRLVKENRIDFFRTNILKYCSNPEDMKSLRIWLQSYEEPKPEATEEQCVTDFSNYLKAASSLPVEVKGKKRCTHHPEPIVGHYYTECPDCGFLGIELNESTSTLTSNSNPVEVKEEAKIKWDRLNKGISEWEEDEGREEGKYSAMENQIVEVLGFTKAHNILQIIEKFEALQSQLAISEEWNRRLVEVLTKLSRVVSNTHSINGEAVELLTEFNNRKKSLPF